MPKRTFLMWAAALFVAAYSLVAGAVVTPSAAASFNCHHAVLPAEIAICGNANLGQLDEQTAGMYFLIVGSAPSSTVATVKAAQGKFIARRNACEADIDCLVSAYTDQIMLLKNIKGDLGL
jgi:uncharacterized protein